jgi:hypothetical protein
LHAGSDAVAIVVEVSSSKLVRATFAGRVQAAATALGAALIARGLEAEVPKAGVWLPEQVLNASNFLRQLTQHGWRVDVCEA